MPNSAPHALPYDLAIAGGGLAGGLLALALAERRPDLKLVLIEAAERFGGHHIWSFFDGDIDPAHRWLVDPLISRRWAGYDVHFPKYSRRLSSGYCSIESQNLDRVLRRRLPAEALINGQKVRSVEAGRVRLDDGQEIRAKAVIDVRGNGDLSALDKGWQTFCGQMLKLAAPHGLERPIIMDATVDQIGGYRFVYCLPFSATEIFVEDTYYADRPELDTETVHARIAAYAAARGWTVDAVLSEERGRIPVLHGGDFDAFWRANGEIDARAGTRAALVQPITGYSLPMAVRTAMLIAEMPEIDQNALDDLLCNLAQDHWKASKFYRLLSAFLFLGADPEKRYKTLEHTYAKDEQLLVRFYAGRSTLWDRLRLLIGKPPIPVSRALWLLLKHR